MFGKSLFREMEHDPFFDGFNEHMRHADSLFRDPFHGVGMLEDGRTQNRGHVRGGRGREPGNEVAPFGAFNFGNMFGNMDRMMKDVDKAMEKAFSEARSDNGHMYQQSSFMSYQKTGDGPPKVYQASSATKSGPGGVRETKKALRDSERELEKMCIGHHIYDRGHELERHRNTRSGQTEEMQNYLNISEKDAEAFNREWEDKTRTAFRGLNYGDRSGGRRREFRDDFRERPVGHREERRELRDRPRAEHRGRSEQLALPAPESSPQSEHWGRSAEGKDRR